MFQNTFFQRTPPGDYFWYVLLLYSMNTFRRARAYCISNVLICTLVKTQKNYILGNILVFFNILQQRGHFLFLGWISLAWIFFVWTVFFFYIFLLKQFFFKSIPGVEDNSPWISTVIYMKNTLIFVTTVET